MPVASVVSWEEAPGVFAWKYPSSELATWSQLVVHESQEACLFKDGQCVGPFGPGRHTLSTQNYPVLRTLLKIPFGRSPFMAEVWFAKKNFDLAVKWGTPTPIQLEDPKYRVMLPVRAFGQFGVTVEDTARFLVKMVGTLPAFTKDTLTDYFRGIVVMTAKTTIARYLVEDGTSILELGARLDEISAKIEKALKEAFSGYGLGIVSFTTASVGTDERDPAVARIRRALAERAEMDILGDRYQMKRSFDVMDSAASNQTAGAGTGMGMGVGVGMGMGGAMFGMARQMAGNMAAGPASAPAPAPASAPAPAPAAGPADGTKFCMQCGTKLPAAAKFCFNCGARI